MEVKYTCFKKILIKTEQKVNEMMTKNCDNINKHAKVKMKEEWKKVLGGWKTGYPIHVSAKEQIGEEIG